MRGVHAPRLMAQTKHLMPLAEHYLLRVGALLADVNAFFWVVGLPALQVEPFGCIGCCNLGDRPVAVFERVEGCVLEP